jgi:competence protein ComEA
MKRVALLFAALLAYAGLAFAAVNINSATKEQLESLDGVGPVKAQAIIDYRKKNGPFKKLEDVKNVDGIGEATYDKIKGNIQLSGTTKIDKPADDKKPAAKPEPKPEPKAKADDTKADAKAKADKEKADAKAKAETTKADAKADATKADAKAKAETTKADAKAKSETTKADAKAKAETDTKKADADAKKAAADEKKAKAKAEADA